MIPQLDASYINTSVVTGRIASIEDLLDWLYSDHPAAFREAAAELREIDQSNMEARRWFLYDYLFDELFQQIAPEGTYFSAHPGDGSDVGFWEVEFLWA